METPNSIPPEIVAAKADLARDAAAARSTPAPAGITEEAIAAKIAASGGKHGLDRETAIRVLVTQAAHDAQLAGVPDGYSEPAD